MKTKAAQVISLVVLVGLSATLVTQRQALRDWWLLRGYTPPSAAMQLATDATMTDEGRHLWYVNRPEIVRGHAFTSECPAETEKTIVLGCYLTGDSGIYIYDITDARLDGVEQVTAAHEMLHAAYDRLSRGERSNVDTMLTDYYDHGLSDQRVKDIINAYKLTEPGDVVNEMHSIFGTEVADLPPGLEQYYAQYFVNRKVVATYAAKYESEFTGRRAQVTAYRAQLKDLKGQIDTNQDSLVRQKSALESQSAQLSSLKSSGQVAAYNAAVPPYNRAVDSYNALSRATKSQIDQYNTIVDQLNAVVLEEQELTKALSANSL